MTGLGRRILRVERKLSEQAAGRLVIVAGPDGASPAEVAARQGVAVKPADLFVYVRKFCMEPA